MVQSVLLKKDEQIKEVSQVLNKQVANLNVLYMKVHHFHWYVKGPHFFALHTKFEEIYDEVTLHMDEVAERVLTIGGTPVSTLKQCLSDSTIKEAEGNENERQMVEILRADLNTITNELSEGMEIAENNKDEATSDMLLGIKSSFEKHMWMLSSYLEK
jgi:starvation-inducible DNA-binding protein